MPRVPRARPPRDVVQPAGEVMTGGAARSSLTLSFRVRSPACIESSACFPVRPKSSARWASSPQLIGRSHECDYPAAVTHLPALTEPKFNPDRPSGEIDREVRRIVGEALSVYRVDAQKLRDLAPDVIVTQSQCEVCAVSERDVEDAVGSWLGAPPRIVSLAPYGLADTRRSQSVQQYIATIVVGCAMRAMSDSSQR